ncbi:MAG: hypothetical protein P4M09_02410, partial [Devosia sp.]|nr:hypothetical protein [Devosia sp.]
MASLRRAPNGEWYSRRLIPDDVREAYSKAHGTGREVRFRAPGDLPDERAKAEFRDWDATVSTRIDIIRSTARGEGVALTFRQLHGLAGEWYGWFVTPHEEEPGRAWDWDEWQGRLEAVYRGFHDQDDNDDYELDHPTISRHARAAVSELGRVPSFLVEKGLKLDEKTSDAFLDVVEDELLAAIALLQRRTSGDYRRDRRPETFPPPPPPAVAAPAVVESPAKATGMQCFDVFRAWVEERKPAAATVNRWRSVFLGLGEHFMGRDIATITADDAVAWKDTLVTEERSAHVANDVWIRAAKTVFEWALKNRKVTANPFKDVAVAVAAKKTKTREREFTETEARTILSATLAPAPERMATHNANARRWVPWLCAYTGARSGEVAQLRAEDVRQRPLGFWTIHITPDAGTVKGGQMRVVPLHEHLIEQGFIDFVKGIGKGPL